MKKRILAALLCLALLAGIPITATATDNWFDLGQTWDQNILAGGIYDMFVWTGENPEDYTYQWQVDLGFGKGHWSDLNDSADSYGYKGTNTFHMELITSIGNGQIEGTGWEDIPFCCKVTHKKTGVTRYTPNMYMHIYTSDGLAEYMAKRGVTLYTPSAGTGTPSTTDDVTYHTTATAGQQLKLICGFYPPEKDPLMARSELRADLEIWVTENGKTTKLSSDTYFPYTIGKDKVTVDFKLHHKIGITDLGYYQTKTLKISVAEPAVVGTGVAKHQMSLLKDPYSQSQKLITIPKDATVNVCRDSGSWYQVSYNGYLGYVSGSSLVYRKGPATIDHVDLTLTDPVVGRTPPQGVTVETEGCFATYIDWYDNTAKHFMKPTERFQEGHSYDVIVWVEAEDDYRFRMNADDSVATTALINDSYPAFTYKAYEQEVGKVIEIRYTYARPKPQENTTHTHTLSQVSAVAPTCTQNGYKAHYRCVCGKTFADAAGTQEVSLSTWGVIPATGHTPSGWRTTGAYHYKACTTCGEFLEQEDHKGGKATCVDKGKCTVCGYEYLETTEEHTPDASQWVARGSMYHFHKCKLCGAHCDIEDHRWSPTYLYQDKAGHAWICADCKAHSDVEPHNPGPAATETTPQTCKDCGYIITPAKNHKHDLQKVPAVAATCTQPGNIEYYTCTGCMDCFTDPQGKNKLPEDQSVELAPLGHQTSDTWKNDESYHWRTCSVCKEILEETRMVHEPANGPCATCGYDPAAKNEPNAPQTTGPVSPPPADPDTTSDGMPGWALLLISLLAVGVGVGAGYGVLTRKKKE